jgi:DNA-binding HxlR family transcriptional regulator
MSDKRNTSSASSPRRIERAIVLQLLRDGRPERWSREDLIGELAGVAPETLDATLLALERVGVLHRSNDAFWASSAARRLDEIGLIGV